MRFLISRTIWKVDRSRGPKALRNVLVSPHLSFFERGPSARRARIYISAGGEKLFDHIQISSQCGHEQRCPTRTIRIINVGTGGKQHSNSGTIAKLRGALQRGPFDLTRARIYLCTGIQKKLRHLLVAPASCLRKHSKSIFIGLIYVGALGDQLLRFLQVASLHGSN